MPCLESEEYFARNVTLQIKNLKNLSSAQRMYEKKYHNNNQRTNVVVQNVYTRVSLGRVAKGNDNAANGLGECFLSVSFLPVTTPFAQ